jgi:hypothetical protein
MKFILLGAVFSIGLLWSGPSQSADTADTVATADTKPHLVSVQRIWDQAPHNAFTDLLFHDGRWYCVFREGSRHVSPDGSLRVLTSDDGEQWKSLALVTDPVEDLRDAKLSVTPDGKLMLNGAGMQAEQPIRYHSMVWFSSDKGQTWSDAKRIGDPGFWLWRAQWHDGFCYSMGYSTNRQRDQRSARFYRSRNGADYQLLIRKLNLPNGVGEDKILFLDDGSALCLFRNETGDKTGFLGRSSPPYDRWDWKSLNARIGGPNMIRLPDGRIIAVTRLYDQQTRTSLSWLDADQATLTECLTLPSGGDTSYAGLVWKDNLLWISYYSSHEEKACIYVAKVAFK